MSISKEEEIIATLWIIAALIAFGNGYNGWGWVFTIKGGLDLVYSIFYGMKEVTRKRNMPKPDEAQTDFMKGINKQEN